MRRTQHRAQQPPARRLPRAAPASERASQPATRRYEDPRIGRHRTAAAGALKCRPCSFMRRASSLGPTDGCRGRPKVRVPWSWSRRKFARIRLRSKKRRKKEHGLQVASNGESRDHEEEDEDAPSERDGGPSWTDRRRRRLPVPSRDRPQGSRSKSSLFSGGKCARISRSATMCSCLRSRMVLRQ